MRLDWCYKPLGLEGNFATFHGQLRRLVHEAHAFLQSQASFAQKLQAYEEVDLIFERLECALTLWQIEHPEKTLYHLNAALESVFGLLVEVTEEFMQLLSLASQDILPLWAQAMLTESERNIIPADFYDCPLGEEVSVQNLRNRINSDPIEKNVLPCSFNLRSTLQGWDSSSINETLNRHDHSDRARAYFNRLMEEMLEVNITLSTLRDYERASWSGFNLSFEQALVIVEQTFSLLNPLYGIRVRNAFEEGRIRLVGPGVSSFCIDTPSGSYIQISFSETLESLALLGHECGHLIHQETIRDKYRLKQDIQAYLTEAIAITFENKVVAYFLSSLGLDRILVKWRDRQYIEWSCRHSLLTEFELALYGLEALHETAIEALWLKVNRAFYPAKADFDKGFASAWQEVAHFIHAPFYLSIYPKAYALAECFDNNNAVFMACIEHTCSFDSPQLM